NPSCLNPRPLGPLDPLRTSAFTPAQLTAQNAEIAAGAGADQRYDGVALVDLDCVLIGQRYALLAVERHLRCGVVGGAHRYAHACRTLDQHGSSEIGRA